LAFHIRAYDKQLAIDGLIANNESAGDGMQQTNIPEKCACPTCNCIADPQKSVTRDGKIYCSQACAYDCTATTCVCIHDRCDETK